MIKVEIREIANGWLVVFPCKISQLEAGMGLGDRSGKAREYYAADQEGVLRLIAGEAFDGAIVESVVWGEREFAVPNH